MNQPEITIHQALTPYEPLLTILRKANFPLRLVGGTVRDALLNRPLSDLDFAAQCEFDQLLLFCREEADKIVANNKKYHNIKALFKNHLIDITLLRQDLDGDGRHANTEITADWLADARRRDFTINALYCGLDGHVDDPLATINQSGLEDLQTQRLRFIDDPAQRIHEDYLRILRYFRFSAQLGFAMCDHELSIIKALKANLQRLSPERVRQEWQKIVMGGHCIDVLAQMQHIALGTEFLSIDTLNIGALEQLIARAIQRNAEANFITRFAALLSDNPQSPIDKDQARCWRLSRHEYDQLRQLQQPCTLVTEANQTEAGQWLYHYGRKLSQQRYLLHMPESPQFWNFLQHDPIPKLPVDGREMIRLGYRGKEIGKILKKIEQYWLNRAMEPDREDILVWLGKS